MKLKFRFFGVLIAALLLFTGIRAEAAPDWTSQVITATGTGVANPNAVNRTQARLLARRAAIADAYRLLAEMVQGVQVDAETTVDMLITKSDIVKTKVNAIIKGAQIISEREFDGGYEVTMQMPMFGNGGLAEAVLEPPPVVEPFPEPQPPTVNINININGGYTGLIVDCRGFRVNPVMSPVIKNANGQKIYGHKNLDYDKVIAQGMASYAENMSQATRAGSNPLIIKAIATEDFNANPVVNMTDSDLILRENKISGFLDNAAVVFLY